MSIVYSLSNDSLCVKCTLARLFYNPHLVQIPALVPSPGSCTPGPFPRRSSGSPALPTAASPTGTSRWARWTEWWPTRRFPRKSLRVKQITRRHLPTWAASTKRTDSSFDTTLWLNTLPCPRARKLKVTSAMYTRQKMSSQKPKALLKAMNRYHAEECRSCTEMKLWSPRNRQPEGSCVTLFLPDGGQTPSATGAGHQMPWWWSDPEGKHWCVRTLDSWLQKDKRVNLRQARSNKLVPAWTLKSVLIKRRSK